jgi:hypothetical protein
VLAFLFVVACTAGGVVIAAYWERPLYRSTAVLLVPAATTIEGRTVSYPAWLRGVSQMMRSKRVIERAIESDLWKQYRVRALDAGEYDRHLNCMVRPESQTVDVSVAADDPHRAVMAVNAIVQSYLAIDAEITTAIAQQREERLERSRAGLIIVLEQLTKASQELSEPFGTDRLQPVIDFTRAQLEKIEVMQFDQQLAAAINNPPATTSPSAPAADARVKALQKHLSTLHGELADRLMKLGRAAIKQAEFDEQRTLTQKHLQQVEGRLDELHTEAQLAPRTVVLSAADVPTAPACRWCSHRVMWSAGFSGGGALLLVLLIATFYRGS